MTMSRRDAALTLAEELLADIELSRIPAPDIVKKTSRLARLLDDADAVNWLQFEMSGYPEHLHQSAASAAERSNRRAEPDPDGGEPRWWTASLSRLQAEADSAALQLSAATDANISISSANPNQYLNLPSGNSAERHFARKLAVDRHELIGKIRGALYGHVAEREIELRFGAAVEGAFVTLRNVVDARIAKLVPSAAVKLSAAFESASSGNPEHWANAASECRRLLKAVADELRPSGPPVDGRDMSDDKYINRLIDWIAATPGMGKTLRDVMTADLEDFGKRIDALDDAGHKGAHDEVTQYEASRFITGTSLLLGDILNLLAEDESREQAPDKPVVAPQLQDESSNSDQISTSELQATA